MLTQLFSIYLNEHRENEMEIKIYLLMNLQFKTQKLESRPNGLLKNYLKKPIH